MRQGLTGLCGIGRRPNHYELFCFFSNKSVSTHPQPENEQGIPQFAFRPYLALGGGKSDTIKFGARPS